MMCCAVCDASHKELLKTAYGKYICGDCWDDYICTDRGRLEYLIGICNEDYPMSDFDADFLGQVVESWKIYGPATVLSNLELSEIENKARKLGLL